MQVCSHDGHCCLGEAVVLLVEWNPCSRNRLVAHPGTPGMAPGAQKTFLVQTMTQQVAAYRCLLSTRGVEA